MSRGETLKSAPACLFGRCSTPGCRSDTGAALNSQTPKSDKPMTLKHPMLPPSREIETFEPYAVQAAFADALVRVESIGPCRMLVFSQLDQSDPGRPQRAVVAKIILPADVLAAIAAELLAQAQPGAGGLAAASSAHTVQ